MPDPLTDLSERQTSPAEQRLLASRSALAVDVPPDESANSVFFVSMDDNTLGVWKPLGGVGQFTAATYGHRPEDTMLNEGLAWQLAKELGEPYTELVPTAVWREIPNMRDLLLDANPAGVERPRELYGEDYNAGILIEYVPGRPAIEPFTGQFARQAADAAFVDALNGQQDRHLNNFRWDDRAEQLHLIDNGFAFPPRDATLNESAFLKWRTLSGDIHIGSQTINSQLTEHEQALLHTVLENRSLEPMAAMLGDERGSMLLDRAETMRDAGRLLAAGNYGTPRPLHVRPEASEQARRAQQLNRLANPRPASEGLTKPPTDARRPSPPKPSSPRRQRGH
jgi:hypothetical protein